MSSGSPGRPIGASCTSGTICTAGVCGGGTGPTIYFSDDFSDNSGQWDSTTEGKFRDGIQNGKYVQEILQDPNGGVQVFAASTARTPDLDNLGDVSVQVTATKTAGSGANGYGLACRTGGGTLSYYFVVGSTGGWAIEKSDAGGQPVLKQGTDPFIKKGNNAPNTIRGVCVGGTKGTPVTLTLFVNGHKVDSVQDTPDAQVPGDTAGVFSAGTVGLVSVGNKGLTVEFDDFRVEAAG